MTWVLCGALLCSVVDVGPYVVLILVVLEVGVALVLFLGLHCGWLYRT